MSERNNNAWYDEIPQFTIHTKNHADNFNQVNERLFSNTKYNKDEIESLSDEVSNSVNELDEKISQNLTYINLMDESKAELIHRHTKSEITDFPTSLPANGGNADTLGGMSNRNFVHMPTTKLSVEDLNNAKYPNAYRTAIINGSEIDLPVNSWYHIDYFRHLDNNGYGFQMAYPLSHDGAICARWSSGTTWQPWTELYDSLHNKALPLKGGDMKGSINLGAFPLKFSTFNKDKILLDIREFDANGSATALEAGGLTVLGGGEGAATYLDNLPDGGNFGTENAVIASDQNIIFRTGIQGGFDDNKKLTIDNTGRLRLSPNGMTFPTTGGQWISGKTSNKAIIITGNSTGNYHPIMRYDHSSGMVSNIGVHGNRLGFWGYLAETVANTTNAGAYLDVANNGWCSNGLMNAGNSNGNLKRTTVSSASPSGGVNGDVWIKYS